MSFPEIDLVIGIGSGGIVPASMIAHQLQKPLEILQINYRNTDNSIKYEQPKQISEFTTQSNFDCKILLVDDVSVSGKTLECAKKILNNLPNITTFVLKGKMADIVLFPDVNQCVNWPWKVSN